MTEMTTTDIKDTDDITLTYKDSFRDRQQPGRKDSLRRDLTPQAARWTVPALAMTREDYNMPQRDKLPLP